jgi:hypothetical protein
MYVGKEDTDDGNTSRSQSADSMVASSDGVNDAKVNIVQELDVQKEIIIQSRMGKKTIKQKHMLYLLLKMRIIQRQSLNTLAQSQ